MAYAVGTDADVNVDAGGSDDHYVLVIETGTGTESETEAETGMEAPSCMMMRCVSGTCVASGSLGFGTAAPDSYGLVEPVAQGWTRRVVEQLELLSQRERRCRLLKGQEYLTSTFDTLGEYLSEWSKAVAWRLRCQKSCQRAKECDLQTG